MNRIKLVVAAVLCIVLCSCSSSGVGDKLVARAIYVEKAEGYTVHLLALKADTNADTGAISEQIVTLTGQGESLYDAMLQAEQSENREMFYGQNEILLLGPNLCRRGLFEACEYLSKESSGRPNMAVYGVDISAKELADSGEAGLELLENINQMEASGFYKTYLYELSVPQHNGVLPLVAVDTAGKVQPLGLCVYKNEVPYLQLDKNTTELAALLTGQRNQFHFGLQLDAQPVSFDLKSFHLSFDANRADRNLQLTIHINGEIQNLVAKTGMVKPEESEALLHQINLELQNMLQLLIAETIGKQNDVFALLSPLKNAEEAMFYARYGADISKMQQCIYPKVELKMK